jgi:hypothetical protein
MKRDLRREHINQLIKQGYGSTPGQVINYLVDRELDDLLRERILTPVADSNGERTE